MERKQLQQTGCFLSAIKLKSLEIWLKHMQYLLNIIPTLNVFFGSVALCWVCVLMKLSAPEEQEVIDSSVCSGGSSIYHHIFGIDSF